MNIYRMTPGQRLAEVDRIIGNIRAMMGKPALRELTSAEMKIKADSKRQMATGIKLRGGAVRPEYEYDGN